MAEPFVGEIRMFSFRFAPRGWAQCNGQILPVVQNQVLFSLLGTCFGGNGQTTFALPDLRSRVAFGMGIGPDNIPIQLGAQAGQESVTLSTTQTPAHTHSLTGVTDNGAVKPFNNAYLAQGFDKTASAQTAVYGSDTGSLIPLALQASGITGAGAAHNNIQPSLVVNFCIALVGLYPPRG